MPAFPSEPILERLDDGLWRAGAYARGPFPGVQGGVVAGLMAAEIEAVAPEGFRPLAVRADFLRPVLPDVRLRVQVSQVQIGRRLAVYDAVLDAEGQVKARCSMTLASEVAIPDLAADFASDAPPPATDPESLPRRAVPPQQLGPWLMEVLDPRMGPDGSVWFRWQVPLLTGVSAFTAALAPADFTHGMARPGQPGPSPAAAYPNPDLTVHFTRAPRGEWIGVRPATRWRQKGLGLGYGDLVDRDGSFGHAAMGVVLIPR